MNAKNKPLIYAFGSEAGMRRLVGLPPLEVAYPPLVLRSHCRLPHFTNPCTDGIEAFHVMRMLVVLEMRKRLRLFASAKVRSLADYNAGAESPLPRISLIIAGMDGWDSCIKESIHEDLETLLGLGRAAGFRLSPIGDGAEGGGAVGLFDRYKRGQVSREEMTTALIVAHKVNALPEADYRRMMDDVTADVYLDERLAWDDDIPKADTNKKGENQ